VPADVRAVFVPSVVRDATCAALALHAAVPFVAGAPLAEADVAVGSIGKLVGYVLLPAAMPEARVRDLSPYYILAVREHV